MVSLSSQTYHKSQSCSFVFPLLFRSDSIVCMRLIEPQRKLTMRRARKAAATDRLPDRGAAARPGVASATASRAAAAPAAAAGAELSDSCAPCAIAATLERSAASAASALAASMLIWEEERRSPCFGESPPESLSLPHHRNTCHVSGSSHNSQSCCSTHSTQTTSSANTKRIAH